MSRNNNSNSNRDNATGRFIRCGNPHGRPRKVVVDPALPMSRRKAISAAVDRIVPVVIKGRKPEDDYVEEMSIFEACIYRLGILGAQGNRVAANNLVQLAVSNSIAAQHLAMWEASLNRHRDPLNKMPDDQLIAEMLRVRREINGVNDDDEGGEVASDRGSNSPKLDPLDA